MLGDGYDHGDAATLGICSDETLCSTLPASGLDGHTSLSRREDVKKGTNGGSGKDEKGARSFTYLPESLASLEFAFWELLSSTLRWAP